MPEEPTTPTPPPPPEAPPPEEKVPMGGLRILLYVISFLIPLAGLIIGIIYFTKESPEEKQFGKMCLILAAVGFLVGCLCFCAIYAGTVGLGIFQAATQGGFSP